MKKTTKKLVSLLTILAFMLTALVPSFAFAAGEPAAPAKPSIVEPVKATDTKVTVNFSGLKEGDKVQLKKGTEDLGEAKVLTAAEATANKVEIAVSGLAKGDKLTAVVTKAEGDTTAKSDAVTVKTEEQIKEEYALSFMNGKSFAVLEDATEGEGLEVDPGEEATLQVGFVNDQNRATAYEGDLYVWAEEAANTPDANFVIDGQGFTKMDGKNIYKSTTFKTAADTKDITVKFTAGGNYRVYVSTVDPSKDNWKADNTFESTPNKLKADKNLNKAKVTSADVKVGSIGIKSVNSPEYKEVELTDGKVYGKDVDKDAPDFLYVDPNGVSKTEVIAYIYGTDGLSIGKDKAVTISTNNSGIAVDPEKAKTDFAGKVKFNITGKVEGEYKVYVEAGNVRVTIPVKVAPLRANTIEKVDSPDYPLSTDMRDNEDELSFRIKDIDGNTIVNALKITEGKNIVGVDGMRKQLGIKDIDGVKGPIYDVQYEGDFIKIVKKPAASKLKAKDLELREDEKNGVYYVNFDKDLVEGDYVIKFTLDNGQSAEFAFTVKKFGTAKELKLSYPQKYVELGYHSGNAKVQFIDENGVRKNAKNYVSLGANGYALKDFDQSTGVVTVKADEAYLGSTIQVTAIAEKEGLVADTELVVTDGKGGDKTLTFDPKNGPVNQSNRVKVQVVDSKGNAIALGDNYTITSMVPVVVEKSEKDANVTASIGGSYKAQLKEDGTAEMIVRSDKATSADIKVTIAAKKKDEDGEAIASTFYRGTVHYVFSDKAEFAGRTVVMTINSNQVIVNNNIVTIDTAAIIKNERTFVPFRALAEALGAEVDYNNDTRVVTAKMEGKTVAMTVDKDTYTVDGKEAKLDVAPYVQDSRTMIPVRFAAEALGYKVTPTYHADGTTASVAFQK